MVLRMLVFLVAVVVAVVTYGWLRQTRSPRTVREDVLRGLLIVALGLLLPVFGLLAGGGFSMTGAAWTLYVLEQHWLVPVTAGIVAGFLMVEALHRADLERLRIDGIWAVLKEPSKVALVLASIILTPLLAMTVVGRPDWWERVEKVSIVGAGEISFQDGAQAKLVPSRSSAGDGVAPPTAAGMAFSRPRLEVLEDLVAGDAGSRRSMVQRDRRFVSWTELSHNPAFEPASVNKLAQPDQIVVQGLKKFVECLRSYVDRTGDTRVVVFENAGAVARLAAIERTLRQQQRLHAEQGTTSAPQYPLPTRFKEAIDALTASLNWLSKAEDPVNADASRDGIGRSGVCASAGKVLATDFKLPDKLTGDFNPYLALFVASLYAGVGANQAALVVTSDWIEDFRSVRRARETAGVSRAAIDSAYPIWFELRMLIEMFWLLVGMQNQPGAPALSGDFVEELEWRFRWLRAFSAVDLEFRGCLNPRRMTSLNEADEQEIREELAYSYQGFQWWRFNAIARDREALTVLGIGAVNQARKFRDSDPRCLPRSYRTRAEIEDQTALQHVAFAHIAVAYLAARRRDQQPLSSADRSLAQEARLSFDTARTIFMAQRDTHRRNLAGGVLATIVDTFPRSSVLPVLDQIGVELRALDAL